MEAEARRITKTQGWTYVGGVGDAKKPAQVVIKAFDHDVLGATGSTDAAPDGAPVVVPEGEGRRLEGFHFFVRPAPPEAPCTISLRGL